MRIKIFFVVCVLLLSPALCLAAGLEIAIAVSRGGDFVKPLDKTVVVQQQPMPFSVILTNRSGSSQMIYWVAGTGGMSTLFFELTDERGNFFVVKHRAIPNSANLEISSNLASGQNVTKTLLMDTDEWENIPILEPGIIKKYQIRVVYDNNNSKIYSDYYTLILDGR